MNVQGNGELTREEKESEKRGKPVIQWVRDSEMLGGVDIKCVEGIQWHTGVYNAFTCNAVEVD